METKTLLDPLTFDELCAIEYDGAERGDWWFVRDVEAIAIVKQKLGEPSTEEITIPVATLKKMIDLMQAPQKIPTRADLAAVRKVVG